MKVKIRIWFLIIFVIFCLAAAYLLRRPSGIDQNTKWGVTFSRPFAVDMGLNWRETYLALLDDLKVKRIRLPIYWQDVEPRAGNYDFSDYDWMIDEAEKRNVQLILVVGRKLPRWPECHTPAWANNLSEKYKQEKILDLISASVNRYKDIDSLYLWQVDNEPFLPFGECPTSKKEFVDQEVETVRRFDINHKIMVTDSGELSIWLHAAKRADIFGTTMYRIIYNNFIKYLKYPLPPRFFWLKANIVHLFFPNKPIIVSELQAEPWGPKLIYDLSIEEQEKSMNISQFKENIDYAKAVGFPENYLWGAEWWYWLKVKHNDPRYWQEVKKLIAGETESFN